MNEYRYTVGADARLRMGPFSLDPTILYQFGNRAVIAPSAGVFVTQAGAVPNRRYLGRSARSPCWRAWPSFFTGPS